LEEVAMHDKRNFARLATLSPCLIKPVFTGESLAPLRIINHSRSGVMLELDTPLGLGDYVDIQFSPDALEATGFWMRRCVGLVRWCRCQDGNFGGRYGVGLELTSRILLGVPRGSFDRNDWN
jgi:hypothetical protein